MSNKTGDVTWSEENDEDLDDSVEANQSNNYANNIVAGAPARTRNLPEPPVSTVKSETHVPVHDLRTMINRLNTINTSINNFNNLGSRTSTDTTSHAAYSEWKSEPDWRTRFDTRTAHHTDIDRRSDRRNDIEASKLAPTGSEDLESSETLAAGTSGSAKIPSSRPVASGITLVALRSTSTTSKAASSSTGRPSASDVIAQPRRDTYRPQSQSRSHSRGRDSSRREKSRSRSRNRSWSRSRRRSWSRSRGKARSRSRDQSKEKNTSSRYGSRSRGRSRSRDRRRSTERIGDGRKSRGRSRSRSRSRSQERSRDGERDKDKDRRRGRSRDRSTGWSRGYYRSRGGDKSRSRSVTKVKEEDKTDSRPSSLSGRKEASSTTLATSPSVHGTVQISSTSTNTTTNTTKSTNPISSLSLSTSLAGQPTTSPSSANTARSNSKKPSNTKTPVDTTDQTRHTTVSTMSSSPSSTATAPLQQGTDPTSTSTNCQLEDTMATSKIKVEPEAPPTLVQLTQLATNLSLVNVKEEPLDATNNILLGTPQPATPNESEESNPMEQEAIVPHDAHYFVIRVTDEGDFLDARKSSVWPTNPMYDKALREFYSPTSHVFLIFTVFMSSKFCGIARMASDMMWVGERTIFDKSKFRQKFKLEWVACSQVSYDSVKELTHEPVYKIIRKTGYKLSTNMGCTIHKLLVENQTEKEPQPTLSLQTEMSDLSALDASFNQDILMGENMETQEDPILQINLLYWDTSDMDVDMHEEPVTTTLKDKEDDEVSNASSSMDLDSDLDTARIALIKNASPMATLRRSPSLLARKRSISADEGADLSTEMELAKEDQLTRVRPPEQPIAQVEQKKEEAEEQGKEENAEEEKLLFGKEVLPPPRAKSPETEKRDSSPKRWPSLSRRSPPPPPRHWSPPPLRRRSLSPPVRNRSPPPRRRNRSPPPPRRRSPPPPRRRSPPPYRQAAYERSGTASSTSSYGAFRSPPPFPQRSKDPRDRSTSTYVFHTGNESISQRDRFNAPTDPRLLGRAIIPQKRPFEDSPALDTKDGVLAAGDEQRVDLPASVFPLEDDVDDGLGDHIEVGSRPGVETGAGSSSSGSSTRAVGGPSAAITTETPPSQIKSITLVPSGLSKTQRKKLRKQAFAKPLDF